MGCPMLDIYGLYRCRFEWRILAYFLAIGHTFVDIRTCMIFGIGMYSSYMNDFKIFFFVWLFLLKMRRTIIKGYYLFLNHIIILVESVAKKMFQSLFLNEYGYFKWVKTPFYELITGCTNNQDVLVHIYSQYKFFLNN